MSLADQANLIVNLSLKDNLSGALKGIRGSLGTLDQNFGRTQASLGKFGNNLKNVALIGVGAVVGGFALAIREASTFEAALNTINTVAKVSQEELTGIGDNLRALARDTGQPLEDLTAAYYDLVSAGVDAADAQGVLTAANTLAIGGLATTGETVDLLTTAINAYGLEADKAADISDYFAQAINAGKVTAADLASSFATVAPIAASAGIEIDELAATYAQLTAQGVPAAEASTQMRSAIIALQRPTDQLRLLEEKLGVSFKDIAEEQGLQEAYSQIRVAADDAGIEMITLTGRVEGTQYALGVTGEQAAGFEQNLIDVRAATDGAGEASLQAAERQKGLSYEFGRLKTIGQDVAIMFGTEMLPPVTRIVSKLGELIDLNYPKLEKLAGRVGDALDDAFSDKNLTDGIGTLSRKIGNLLDNLGTSDLKGTLKTALGFLRDMPWDTISGGLKITGDAAKLIIDTFRSLPPDIQKILIGALAINKVTGGLLTSVVKDVAGIALRSLTTITAANVTVVGTNVTSPGGGLPGGAAGTAGLAGALAPITIGAVSAIAFDQFALSQSQAMRDTPFTVGELDTVAKSGFGQVFAHANDPMMQFFSGMLGPGVRDVANEVGKLGDRSMTIGATRSQEAQRAALINSEVRERIGISNSKLAVITGLGADHRMELRSIAQRAQEQKNLTQIGNHAMSEAKERLGNIQISSQRTAQKDLSVNVTTRVVLNVAGRQMAEAMDHFRRTQGGQV